MHYVVLRDDDTNALTPVEYLDRLYRPFLDRKLPVNLAVIPEVTTNAKMGNGQPEGFLLAKGKTGAERVRLEAGSDMARYLQANPLYEVAQHGCHHEYCEFDLQCPREAAARLDKGRELLIQAGFPTPQTFIAPHDKISRISYGQLARRYKVVSTGWFELKRLPVSWWPKYAITKSQRKPHWQTGNTVLLSHPGCILSCHHPYEGMLERVKTAIHSQQLTVIVTHWWEYFRGNKPDEPFINVLHQVADYLAHAKDVQVISFRDVGNQKMGLN